MSMKMISKTTLLFALVLFPAACDKETAPVASPGIPAPAAQPAPDRQMAPPATGVTGKVLETMDSGGYTYVRLATPAGERWAAVPEAKVAVGDTVTISNAMEMHDFESKTLGRTFPVILFGTLGAGDAAAPAPNPHAGAAGGGASGTPSKGKIALDEPLARAEGPTGRTVAEVFAQKAALADKPVLIRGKVTKFSGGIMGKNWMHLQDGTGTAEQKDFDLTVTTMGEVAVGDVIVVRGVVRTDKDFGAGYAYAVIVEDATIEP